MDMRNLNCFCASLPHLTFLNPSLIARKGFSIFNLKIVPNPCVDLLNFLYFLQLKIIELKTDFENVPDELI